MRSIHHIWFIVSIVLGTLFIIWGSLAPSMPLIPGDIWLLLPGILLVLPSFFGVFEPKVIERRFIRCFNSAPSGRISLSHLSEALHLSQDNLQELILSLRVQGKIQAYFNSETGELMRTSSSDGRSCFVCGEPNITSAFCQVCGSEQPPSPIDF